MAEEADSGAEEADSGAEEDADRGSHHEHDDPLYRGAAITVGVAMALLLAFIVRHKLTNEMIADLLYLIDHLCPSQTGVARHCTNSHFWFCHSMAINTVHNALIQLVVCCNICKAVINLVKD